MAVRELMGECWTWEPEAVWLNFDHMGIDIPTENRARLQAGITLMHVPSFYWDAVVFEKTALSFDGFMPNPDALEEADVMQLAWAVEEAARIIEWHKDPKWLFMHEPTAYAGVVMHRDGFVIAPTSLGFAQDALDAANAKVMAGLKDETEKAWATLDKDTMDAHTFSETPLGVQLARLAAVELHCRDRRRQLNADITAFKS